MIYTVKNGQTLFEIAEECGVSPWRVAADNNIQQWDAMIPGTELLILQPTRTYTVGKNDTLDQICKRFSLRKKDILGNNPGVCSKGTMRTGEILSLRYSSPSYGMAVCNGYVFKDCSHESFESALPYLTYVTLSNIKTDGHSLWHLWDDSYFLRRAEEEGKVPVLRLLEDGVSLSAVTEEKDRTAFFQMVYQAVAGRYRGIDLAFFRISEANPEKWDVFLNDFRRFLLGKNLILFNETDANISQKAAEGCDASILFYEKACLPQPPTFQEGEERVLRRFAEEGNAARLFIDISPFAYKDGTIVVQRSQLWQNSPNGEGTVSFDIETQLCTLVQKEKNGTEHRTVYESLHNIASKFALIDELGYMGISLDIARTPRAFWMLFHTSFSHMYPAMRKAEDL